MVSAVHGVHITTFLLCSWLLSPHLFFLTLVISISISVCVSIVTYMISKLITKQSFSPWRKFLWNSAIQWHTSIFMLYFLYHLCSKTSEYPIVSVPWLVNFLCTVGSKATLECDVKLAGFEEQVEHRSSTCSVTPPSQSTRQCHPEPLSDSLSFRERLSSKFTRPQICWLTSICLQLQGDF